MNNLVNKMAYPCEIKFSQEDHCYYAQFIDFKNGYTDGETMEEVQRKALDVLNLLLERVDLRNSTAPQPSKIEAENIIYIKPYYKVAFATWLRLKRKEENKSQKDFAKALNISIQAYQNYENPKKANPTLATLLALQEILKTPIVNI